MGRSASAPACVDGVCPPGSWLGWSRVATCLVEIAGGPYGLRAFNHEQAPKSTGTGKSTIESRISHANLTGSFGGDVAPALGA